jgi:hypothetical protein
MKIHPVGAELSVQIDMTELIVACRNVMKAPKIGKDCLLELFGPSLTRPVIIKMTVERPRCPWCQRNRPSEPHAVIYQCDLHSAWLFYCSC